MVECISLCISFPSTVIGHAGQATNEKVIEQFSITQYLQERLSQSADVRLSYRLRAQPRAILQGLAMAGAKGKS